MMNEYDELRHQYPQHADVVWVNWNLGNGISIAEHTEQLSLFVSQLISHYTKKLQKRVYLEFTGNLRKLLPVSDQLQMVQDHQGMIGAYIVDEYDDAFWETFSKTLTRMTIVREVENLTDDFTSLVNSMSSDIDIHVQLMSKNGDFTKYSRIIKKFAKDTKEISISFKIDPKQYDKLNDETQSRTEGLQANIKRIAFRNRTRKHIGIRSDMIMVDGEDKMKISNTDLINKGLNNWSDWTCHAGLEQLVIDDQGSVLRGWCRVGGVLGNYTDGIVMLPTSTIKCTNEACNSSVDVTCTKTWY